MLPRFFVPFFLLLAACANRTEYRVHEEKRTTDFDSADFRLTVFFDGCSVEDGKCRGDLAIAFNSGNMDYEYLIIDTLAVTGDGERTSFVDGAPEMIYLETRNGEKYRHHPFGEVDLTAGAKTELKL